MACFWQLIGGVSPVECLPGGIPFQPKVKVRVMCGCINLGSQHIMGALVWGGKGGGTCIIYLFII